MAIDRPEDDNGLYLEHTEYPRDLTQPIQLDRNQIRELARADLNRLVLSLDPSSDISGQNRRQGLNDVCYRLIMQWNHEFTQNNWRERSVPRWGFVDPDAV